MEFFQEKKGVISMLQCADCTIQSCQVRLREGINEECPMRNNEFLKATEKEYQNPLVQSFYKSTVIFMQKSFDEMTRVLEIMAFCRLMNYKKIGIAFCGRMVEEGRIFNEILRENGFTPISANCKVGGYGPEDLAPTQSISIESIHARPMATCNPIGQAELLNMQDTDFNVLIGLCVGHDSLFFKYAKAPCTVLVVKDKMMNHNPVADLYSWKSHRHI